MKFHAIFALASLHFFSVSTHALLTPTRQSLPSGALIAKASTSSSSRLGNEAANVADLPRGGGSNKKSTGSGTATIPNEVFNLIKSIVGAGVLSLPAGK